MNEQCEDCKYWQRYTDEDLGCCWRYPPAVVSSLLKVQKDGEDDLFASAHDTLNASTHPITHCSDSCGEWARRLDEQS